MVRLICCSFRVNLLTSLVSRHAPWWEPLAEHSSSLSVEGAAVCARKKRTRKITATQETMSIMHTVRPPMARVWLATPKLSSLRKSWGRDHPRAPGNKMVAGLRRPFYFCESLTSGNSVFSPSDFTIPPPDKRPTPSNQLNSIDIDSSDDSGRHMCHMCQLPAN